MPRLPVMPTPPAGRPSLAVRSPAHAKGCLVDVLNVLNVCADEVQPPLELRVQAVVFEIRLREAFDLAGDALKLCEPSVLAQLVQQINQVTDAGLAVDVGGAGGD